MKRRCAVLVWGEGGVWCDTTIARKRENTNEACVCERMRESSSSSPKWPHLTDELGEFINDRCHQITSLSHSFHLTALAPHHHCGSPQWQPKVPTAPDWRPSPPALPFKMAERTNQPPARRPRGMGRAWGSEPLATSRATATTRPRRSRQQGPIPSSTSAPSSSATLTYPTLPRCFVCLCMSLGAWQSGCVLMCLICDTGGNALASPGGDTTPGQQVPSPHSSRTHDLLYTYLDQYRYVACSSVTGGRKQWRCVDKVSRRAQRLSGRSTRTRPMRLSRSHAPWRPMASTPRHWPSISVPTASKYGHAR